MNTPPNANPTVTLGDQQFVIPELPLGVTRLIDPITRRMSKRSLSARGSNEEIQEAMISEENLDDAQMIVAIALAYASEDFDRSRFGEQIAKQYEELKWKNIGVSDILAASIVIAIQAGGKKLGEKMEEAKKAMTPPPTPESAISTESSPTSA